MVPPQQSRFVRFTDWVDSRVFPISFVSLGLASFGSLARVRLDPLLVVFGALLFIIAVAIHGRVFVTREMKTVQELGFTRNRDFLLYSGSPAGMDMRLGALGICAFLLAIGVGSGVLGSSSGGAALLSFSVFALAGAVARLRRKWPADESPTK